MHECVRVWVAGECGDAYASVSTCRGHRVSSSIALCLIAWSQGLFLTELEAGPLGKAGCEQAPFWDLLASPS